MSTTSHICVYLNLTMSVGGRRSHRRFIPFAVLMIDLAVIVSAKPAGGMITKAKVSVAEQSARPRKSRAHLRQSAPRLLTFAIRAKAGRTCHRIFGPSAAHQ